MTNNEAPLPLAGTRRERTRCNVPETKRRTNSKPRKPVTREDVLSACRTHFDRRWPGRSLDGRAGGVLAIRVEPTPEDKESRKRYRALRDAYLAAAKRVREIDPRRDRRHDRVLRIYLPGLEAIMERMDEALGRLPAVVRQDAWAPWGERMKREFDDGRPISSKDWAVLRILSGYCEFTAAELGRFQRPNDAIAGIARKAREALAYRRRANGIATPE